MSLKFIFVVVLVDPPFRTLHITLVMEKIVLQQISTQVYLVAWLSIT